MGFQSDGTSPFCTRCSWWPAMRRASAGKARMSWSDVPTQKRAFVGTRVIYKYLYVRSSREGAQLAVPPIVASGRRTGLVVATGLWQNGRISNRSPRSEVCHDTSPHPPHGFSPAALPAGRPGAGADDDLAGAGPDLPPDSAKQFRRRLLRSLSLCGPLHRRIDRDLPEYDRGA